MSNLKEIDLLIAQKLDMKIHNVKIQIETLERELEKLEQTKENLFGSTIKNSQNQSESH
jgi:hypothetical protein